MNLTPPTKKPALLLLPNVLGEVKHHEVFLPSSVDRAVVSLDGLIAESEKGGRRFLGRFKTERPAHLIPIALYNEHTPEADLDFLLEPIIKGERWGLVSDGGIPCVADPGSKLVYRARQRGIVIQAFVGPSSVFLALMLSGLPGQQFCFHGYLSKEENERKRQIQALARAKGTQIFIEVPYRNRHALDSLLTVLGDDILLCVAWDLTLPTQGILSQSIALWKKSPLPNLEDKNAIFLIAKES